MAPWIFLVWCLIATVSTSEINDDKESATSYSIIYRYDTPEQKSDSSTIINTGQESKVNHETEQINRETPIVYEKLSDSSDTKFNQAELSKFSNYASQYNEENLNQKYTISPFAIGSANEPSLLEIKSDSPTTSGLSKSPYPLLTSGVGPLVQEGRLITPGLSVYASNYMMEMEPGNKRQ